MVLPRVLLISVLLLMGGCAAIAPHLLKMMGSDKGVSVDAQIGDRENSLGDSVRAGDGSTVNVKKNKFEGEAKDVTINELPWWVLVFVAVGFWCMEKPWVLIGRIKRASPNR